jgi:EAL domain-containing protein (putative c-di-GMP-specific phosphodiesterase class I)
VLEIPESALARHETALDVLRGLAALGVRLHLDDFGRGLTSLSLLHQAPLEALKIGPAALDTGLAGTCLLLARELGLQVIAKGLETPAQAGQLRALGCQLGQGFVFGQPEEEI